jgi:hypothetical protein
MVSDDGVDASRQLLNTTFLPWRAQEEAAVNALHTELLPTACSCTLSPWSQGHSPGEYGGDSGSDGGGGGGEGLGRGDGGGGGGDGNGGGDGGGDGLGGGGRMASTYIRFIRALCVLLDEPR